MDASESVHLNISCFVKLVAVFNRTMQVYWIDSELQTFSFTWRDIEVPKIVTEQRGKQ